MGLFDDNEDDFNLSESFEKYQQELKESQKEDLFAFKGYCMRCGADIEYKSEQGACIKCGKMCCWQCGMMSEDGLVCEECKDEYI
jgi:hypothetical protein